MIAKKILAIHGEISDITKPSWKLRKQAFEDAGVQVDIFQFSLAEDPSYASWEETFQKIDFSKYDALYTSSLGWAMALTYMHKNNITVPRMVLAVPWISFSTLRWEKPNIHTIYQDLWNTDLSHFTQESFVISAKDDDVVPYQSAEKIADMTGAKFILLEQGWHSLKWHIDKIVNLVKYGSE